MKKGTGGRKPLDDPKQRIELYFKGSVIEKAKGKDEFKELCYTAVNNMDETVAFLKELSREPLFPAYANVAKQLLKKYK